MSNRRFGRIALALGVGAIFGGLASLAVAQGEDPAADAGPAHELCADQHPCVIINGAADPNATGSDPTLVTAGEALDASARPADECPAADAAYEELGVDADAVVGRCPKQLPAPSPAAEESIEAALDTEGGS